MNGNNILIIEDDEQDIELMTEVFKHTHWHLSVAKNASEAQRLLKRHHYRAACVDLKIPGMDGVSLVRWIKDKYPHVPIAIVSGVEGERARAQVSDCGAVFLFPKPFTSQDLTYLMNLTDVTEANFIKGQKLRPSWRTTAGGLVVIGCGIFSIFRHPETAATVGVAMLATGVALIHALDSQSVKGILTPKKKE